MAVAYVYADPCLRAFDQQPHRSLEIFDHRTDEGEGLGDDDARMVAFELLEGAADAVVPAPRGVLSADPAGPRAG
mgnify:CR=1 FL=1